MNAKNIISTIMKEKKITAISLSEKLGYNHSSGVTERLRGKKGMRDDIIVKFLEVLSCELVIRDKTSNKEWVVSLEEPNETEPNKTEDFDLDSLLNS